MTEKANELPRVFVTRQLPKDGLQLLEDEVEFDVWPDELPPPREVLLDRVTDLDGLLCLLTDDIDAELLDQAPNLRVVSNYAVGYDNIDVEAATARGIVVTNTPGVLTDATADFAFTLMLSAARRVVEAHDYTLEGKWKTWHPLLLLGHDVYEATLGIVGFGRIGQAVARRASGFDMRVLYHDVERFPAAESELGAEYAELEVLLKESDFVSLHVPLNTATHKLMGSEEFKLMKDTAVLVNTSRGPVIDEGALYTALKEGELAAAGLDVFAKEPVDRDNPLLSLEEVTAAPHIASATHGARSAMARLAAENLTAALSGRQPPHVVNPEVLEE
jgi:glyoxylate reductase